MERNSINRTGKDFLDRFWNGETNAADAKRLYVCKMGDNGKAFGFYYCTLNSEGQLLVCKGPDQKQYMMKTNYVRDIQEGNDWMTFITASGSQYRVADVQSRFGSEEYHLQIKYYKNGEPVYEAKSVMAKDSEAAVYIVEKECPFEVDKVVGF